MVEIPVVNVGVIVGTAEVDDKGKILSFKADPEQLDALVPGVKIVLSDQLTLDDIEKQTIPFINIDMYLQLGYFRKKGQ